MSATPYDARESRGTFWQRASGSLVALVGRENLFTLSLLLALAGCVAYGLSDVIRGLELTLLWFVAGSAMLFGWWLARTLQKAYWAALWAVVIGLGGLLIRVGRLDRPLWQLVSGTVRYLGQGMAYIWALLQEVEAVAPSFAGPVEALSELGRALTALFARTSAWMGALLRGAPIFDPVASMIVWGFILWLAALWAGWVVRRHGRPLLAVIPLGVLLALVLSYTFAGTAPLLLMLGVVLVLMAVVTQNQRERHWERERVDYSSDLRGELIGSAIGLTLVLMALATLTPSLSIDDFIDTIREWRTTQPAEVPEEVAESLGLERRPQPQPETRPVDLDRARAGGLPRRHLIGSGEELSERVVMVISTGELPPLPRQVMTDPAPRHYWRSATYNDYSGRGWYAASTRIESYEAGEPLGTANLEAHRLLRQEVEMVQDIGDLVYVAGALLATDQPYRAAWRGSNDFFAATLEAEHYRADSLISVADAQALRGADLVYPPWVVERYLQLPDDVPERVLSLARDLTAVEPTPYDRAVALERHLRENYVYNLDVTLPPVNRDVVDYFLFDLREGYCDYYASAMTVLARAAGLPARYVIGYASGSYDPEAAHYVVTEADAHAWVEVYFPGFGWVEFEPTAGLPALERLSEPEAVEWPEPEESLYPVAPPPHPLVEHWSLALVGLVALGALGYLIGLQFDLLRLRLVAFEQAAGLLYRRLRRWGERLGVQQRPGDTPYEFLQAFEHRVRLLAPPSVGASREATVLEEVREVITAHASAAYAPALPGEEAQRTLITAWHRLRWRLWWVYLWRYYRLYERLFGPDEPSSGPYQPARDRYAPPPGLPRA